MMRSQLIILGFMFHIAACPVFAAEVPEPFLPKGVAFGMTDDAVRATRPNAFKPEIAILPYRIIWPQLAKDGEQVCTNVFTLMEAVADKNPVEIWYYYFSDRKLASVMYLSAYSIPPKDTMPPFQSLRDALGTRFKKQADERVTRLSGETFTPETKQVESWKDTEGGNIIFFEVENHALRCIIYDPRIFSKTDFFLSDSDIEAITPSIQAVKAAHSAFKPEIEKLENARQEERKKHQTP